MGSDEQRLSEELQRRYLDIRSPRMRAILMIQDEVLSALRDFLRGRGFVEILAPIIGPVTDPGIRGAKQVSIDYYGHQFKVMSSMILYKQMAVCSLGKVFALSPNVRLEPLESLKTGRHLAEFRQLDLEVAKASYHDVMILAERMQQHVCQRIGDNCREHLKSLGRDLKVPRVPFKRLSYHETVDLLRGEGFNLDHGAEIPWDAEEHLSGMFTEPFFIYDYPETARGFYDREDPERSGVLRDFDLIYPEGFGEAISGGEREYEYEKVVNRMRKREEDPTSYGWYLEMLKDGIVPSAGFGIGVERLTRYLCGASKIWETVPFPKVPGIASP